MLDDATRSIESAIELVITGAAMGIDRHAEAWARKRGYPVSQYIPDWTRGKAAGLLRNTDMVEAATWVITIWNGISSGTADTIKKAKAAGKLLAAISDDQPPTPGTLDPYVATYKSPKKVRMGANRV